MKLMKHIGAAFCLLFALQAQAETDICPDAQVLSANLITDICWECLFPIQIAGTKMGSGDKPSKAAVNSALCACNDNLGVPHPGFGTAMWQPTRLIEVVTGSGCSPALGGLTLPLSDIRRQGTNSNTGKKSMDELSYYHYHYYSFPLLAMLDLFIDANCNSDGFMDFDLMYFSEVDPTFNNSLLAMFLHPEAVVFSNPISQMACGADAMAATVGGEPLDSMFWCAGNWGSMYPFSGFQLGGKGFAVESNLIASRAIATMHRKGLEQKTMGDDAMCRGVFSPMIPKSQYKLSMFYPIPEANSSHTIGQDGKTWAAGKIRPDTNNALMTVYKWNDCCVTY